MSYLETRFEGDMKQMLGKLGELSQLLTVLIRNRPESTVRDQYETEAQERSEVPPDSPDPILPPPKRQKVIPKLEKEPDVVEEEEDLPEEEEEEYSEYVVLEEERYELEVKHSQISFSDLTLPFSDLDSLTTVDRQVEEEIGARNEFTRLIMKTLNNSCSLPRIVSLLLTDTMLEQIQKAETSLSDFFIFREYLYPTFFSEVFTSSGYLQQLAEIVSWRIVIPEGIAFSIPFSTSFELDQLELVLSENKEMIDEFSERLAKLFNQSGKQLSLANQMVKLVKSDLILQFNWEGKHHKKKLCQYRHIFEDCFKVVADLEDDSFETKMKKTIRLLHNREHIANTRKRKSIFMNTHQLKVDGKLENIEFAIG